MATKVFQYFLWQASHTAYAKTDISITPCHCLFTKCA